MTITASEWTGRGKVTLAAGTGAGTDYQVKLVIASDTAIGSPDFHLSGLCTDSSVFPPPRSGLWYGHGKSLSKKASNTLILEMYQNTQAQTPIAQKIKKSLFVG